LSHFEIKVGARCLRMRPVSMRAPPSATRNPAMVPNPNPNPNPFPMCWVSLAEQAGLGSSFSAAPSYLDSTKSSSSRFTGGGLSSLGGAQRVVAKKGQLGQPVTRESEGGGARAPFIS
jgi:hypothetical protein